MKILVTGGNGFLGSWVVRELIKRGHSVRVLHRKSSDMYSIEGLGFESAIGDVTDYNSVRAASDGMEAVFHAAAMISYKPRDMESMERINVDGTRNVMQAACDAKVKRVIHTSSVVAVGASFSKKILNEDSPYELGHYPLGYYVTKRKAEDVVREFAREKKLEATIVNPSIMFGAGDAVKGSRKTHLKVAAGEFKFFPQGGVNIMHVEDAVFGHVAALEKGRPGERYILGGENVTLRELFTMLAGANNKRAPRWPVPSGALRAAYAFTKKAHLLSEKPLDSAFLATLWHWYDISKAQKELDFKPRSAYLGVKESVDWARLRGMI